jgi:hypothetical protein
MSRNPLPNKKTDYSQFIARFGCGFLVGILIGGSCSMVYGTKTMGGLITAWIILALLCGLLSVIFGDKFWKTIIHWISALF